MFMPVNFTWLQLAQLCGYVVVEEAIQDRVDAGGGEADKVTDDEVQQVAVTCHDLIINLNLNIKLY